jgi:hypothetical protein
MDPDAWDKEKGITKLKDQFDMGEELISTYFHPYLYLNHEIIEEKGLDLADIQTAVARELTKFDGINLAVTAADVVSGKLPGSRVANAIVNNHNPQRSGDIFIVFEPHAFINDFDGLTVAATHGSPWRYDTHVPVIFAGYGLKPDQVYERIETVDIAGTVTAFVGAKAPSGSSGRILEHVVGRAVD